MRDHECRCFRNPNRHCIVCDRQWPIPELAAPMAAMANITKETEKAMIAAVSEVVESCPACICSAISQAPLPTIEYETPSEYVHTHRYHVEWNYKAERDAYRESKMSMRDYM